MTAVTLVSEGCYIYVSQQNNIAPEAEITVVIIIVILMEEENDKTRE